MIREIQEQVMFQEREQKKIVRAINRNSFYVSNAKYMIDKTNKRIKKYSNKGKIKKVQKEKSDLKTLNSIKKDLSSEIQKGIDILNNKSYKLQQSSKNKIMIDKGRTLTAQLIGGPIGQIIAIKRRPVTTYKLKSTK